MAKKSATIKADKSVIAKLTAKKNLERTPAPIKIGGRDDADLTMRALSIRQPWAEEILRGVKTIEFRGKITHFRGTVYVYASLGRYRKDEEATFVEDIGCEIDNLPRGLIVGTIDILNCVENKKHKDFEWTLANPKRLKILLKPTNQPNPTWFSPFGTPVDD